jgi:hypothetical protein
MNGHKETEVWKRENDRLRRDWVKWS